MSKIICGSAIGGAVEFVLQAERLLADAIAAKGEDCPVGFPNTNYYLPVIYSFTGRKVQILADLKEVLNEARGLLPAAPSEKVWLPYLGSALDAGVAALYACEAIEACKYIIGPNPVDGIYLGAANDVIMRERGIEFVDGTAPGFAAITGAAPDNATAVSIARELQQKNLYVFMGGCSGGKQFAEQLAEEGVQLGWETRLVPFGRDVSSLIYALGFANRAALSFGGVKPGDYAANLKYNKNRIFAFVIALGEVTPEKYAAAAGAINYGFPVIADTDIPQILPTGVCTYEHVVSNVPHDQIVEKALEVRGCKIKIVNVPIPVPYGPAFEGERIRRQDVHVEFGGNKSPCFEFVTSADLDAIVDNDIDLIGRDIDEVEPGSVMPLGIWVEVAGRKMQADFEPILERQIHHLLNGAEGIWHMGQRDIAWTRVSKGGFARGLRIRDYGRILHAKFLADYPAIVDKVKVTLITDEDEVNRRIQVARKVYDERNRRLEAMTDESVDTFYSCLLCQSFAPNHVCVITPERLGLCGAYNWLDGKAAFEIDETGPNQPLKKGVCIDPVKGVWAGVNEYVYINSHKFIDEFTAYSIMDRPMTSCGCFEAIVAYVPECNGVMIVNREYLGETPIGMTFSTLAGSVGGGAQTPGFIGCGKVFLTSRKFMSAEGGYGRIVWMPKELKELLGDDLKKRLKEGGLEDLYDRIADETVTTEASELREYMEKNNHPALGMDDMSLYAEGGGGAVAADAAGSTVAAGAAVAGAVGSAVAVDAADAVSAAGAATASVSADEAAHGPAGAQAPQGASAPERMDTPPAKGPASGLDLANAAAIGVIPADLNAFTEVIRESITKDVITSIIDALSEKFLGQKPAVGGYTDTAGYTARGNESASARQTVTGQNDSNRIKREEAAKLAPAAAQTANISGTASAEPIFTAAEYVPVAEYVPAAEFVPAAEYVPAAEFISASARIGAIKAVPVPIDKWENRVWTVKLGNTPGEGGTRGKTFTIGGASCMPFHLWEGEMPNRPLIAMEVFDRISEKYPAVLREQYKDVLGDPAQMAAYCVRECGADLISVRLDATHPERGDKSADESVELVGAILKAVDVPLIITGHNSWDKINLVMKAVAQSFEGENLLLNWAEQDNYRTIAGAAIAYGHSVVAQAPIDVNISKQLNILLTNMDIKPEKIVMDPMTSAIGYGIEYTYSVMERIRLTGLGGDKMLCGPMIVSPGQECMKIKEYKAAEADFPAWGDLSKRAALWEFSTAVSLLHSGADILIMYHPEAAKGVKKTIFGLMDRPAG